MKERGLYIHIPFCAAKCAYCDFYSLPSTELHEDYVNALCKSAQLLSQKYSDTLFTSIYIGGGTPSILSPYLIKKLLLSVKESFLTAPDAEFTFEANPATLTPEKLEAITGGGVNRLSMGAQSTNEAELKKLSRLHSFDEFRDSFLMARSHGIKNISVDLMYGIPLQTKASLLRSISDIAELSPEHISLYGLRIEPDTPFGRDPSLSLPSDDAQCEMYLCAVETLASLGYERYEISNFAKNGHFSRHNMRYWQCGEYLGLGAAAHSYIDGVRYAYPKDLRTYIRSLENDRLPTPSETEVISDGDRLCEYIMLSLRLEKGISLDSLSARFGEDAARGLVEKTKLYHGKFMIFDGKSLRFTSEGFLVSNTILSEII